MRLTFLRYTPQALAVLIILLCAGSVMLCLGIGGSYSMRYQAGPMQVVAGPEEVWCFVEVHRLVRRPGLFVEPKVIHLGHFQYLVVLTERGVKRRTRISIPNGIDFHPNISLIFHAKDDFLLYEGTSLGIHRSVFRWQEDHFELLPLTVSEPLLRREGLERSDPAGINLPFTIDDWENICQKDQVWFEPVQFEWHGRTLEVRRIDRESGASLSIRCLGEKPWEADLITWDPSEKPLSWREHEGLWNEPRQEGHPQ